MDIAYFTFIYCKHHDDGCIIKGNHSYTPYDFSYCTKDNRICEFIISGTLMYDGSYFKVIRPVRINYQWFGGGFSFIMYKYSIIDYNKNNITNDEKYILETWIKDKSKNKLDTYVNVTM